MQQRDGAQTTTGKTPSMPSMSNRNRKQCKKHQGRIIVDWSVPRVVCNARILSSCPRAVQVMAQRDGAQTTTGKPPSMPSMSNRNRKQCEKHQRRMIVDWSVPWVVKAATHVFCHRVTWQSMSWRYLPASKESTLLRGPGNSQKQMLGAQDSSKNLEPPSLQASGFSSSFLELD